MKLHGNEGLKYEECWQMKCEIKEYLEQPQKSPALSLTDSTPAIPRFESRTEVAHATNRAVGSNIVCH